MKKYFNYQIKKALIVQSLITIESLDVSSSFSYPDESHDFYEFAYIDSGRIMCRTENEDIELLQGDFLLIPPQKRHFYEAIEGCSASLFIVCFRSASETLTVFDKKIALDKEMKKLLSDEGYVCKERLAALREELKILLLPKDKNDEKNCILEIRAGTGGEEAALFAAVLFRIWKMW